MSRVLTLDPSPAPPSLLSRVCAARQGLIRKYNINICRRCFRERAVEIGFQKVRLVTVIVGGFRTANVLDGDRRSARARWCRCRRLRSP